MDTIARETILCVPPTEDHVSGSVLIQATLADVKALWMYLLIAIQVRVTATGLGNFRIASGKEMYVVNRIEEILFPAAAREVVVPPQPLLHRRLLLPAQ